MQESRTTKAAWGRAKTLHMTTLTAVTVVMGVATGASPGAHAEPAKETPLVTCMIQKASPRHKEAVANAVQEGVYCPPSQANSSEGVKCPTEENYRVLVKRAVFELAKECSREFPIRANLPDIEESFMEGLGKDDAVKAMIAKRKDAYQKSRTDFEGEHPVTDTTSPSGK